MKKILILVISILSLSIKAQQGSNYTQYMYNMSVINPAYMIDDLGLYQVGSLYRTQWVGVTGAPKTINAFANIPLSTQIEAGVNIISDKIGSNINVASTVVNIDLAYKIKVLEDMNLSFGLKTGVDNLSINASRSNINGDPLFNNDVAKNIFTMGAGVFAFKDNYYIGFSIPNLIPGRVKSETSENLYKANPHFYLTGGYVFEVSSSFKLKPSVLVKEVVGAPISFDTSVNVLYNNRFELGVSYRFNESIAGLVNISVTPSLRLGYAYDYNMNNLKDYNSGSHEFILLYKFDLLGLSKKYSSPRFY